MSGPPTQQHLIAKPIVSRDVFTAIVWTGTAVATIALAFRYYVRIKCFRTLLPDDFITGFAWILLLATAILWQMIIPDLYEVMEVGAGMRMPTADFPDILGRYSKGQLGILIMFYAGLWSIKANFLVFFYKFGNRITFYRIAWWCVTIFTVCAGFACIGTIQYKCLAASFLEISMNCTGEAAIQFQDVTLKVTCALDVLTDAFIMALPITILWNIRMSTARRLALAGVFALVIITIVISVVRASVVTSAASSNGTSKQVECTWLYTWHFVESFVALLVACLGSFRVLFVSKERSQSAKEAAEREFHEQDNNAQQIKGQAKTARAIHFQESLFDTMATTDESLDQDYQSSYDSGSYLRSGSFGSTVQTVGSADSHGLLPALEFHDLIGEDNMV